MIADLPSLPFEARDQLPKTPGIYLVADANGTVVYVGAAKNIHARWKRNAHHHSKKMGNGVYRIYWTNTPIDDLAGTEQKAIALYQPEWNNAHLAYPSNESYPMMLSIFENAEVVKQIDALAAQEGTSRAALYRKGARLILALYTTTDTQEVPANDHE